VAYAGVPFQSLFVNITALKNRATISLLDDFQNLYPLRAGLGDLPTGLLLYRPVIRAPCQPFTRFAHDYHVHDRHHGHDRFSTTCPFRSYMDTMPVSINEESCIRMAAARDRLLTGGAGRADTISLN